MNRRFTVKLRLTSRRFSCPMYWEIMIPATVPRAETITEYTEENFPARPTPAMLTLPSWPIMIWSTMLKEA